MASSEGIPDFGVFMEVQPDGTSLTFYDFCKVFFLGDLTEVVKLSTFGYARTLADDLDPEQSSPENRLKYIGDPVKQAMLLQILRNFPYLASVPLIITLSLFIASFAKFTIPFIRRFSTLIGQLSGPQRKKRDVDGSIDGILRIPGHLKNITATLSLALEGVEYMAHQDTISQDFFRMPKKRSTKFASYDERKARIGISQVTEVGKVVRSWLKTWIDLAPTVSACFGQVIGCFVRFSYWSSHCKIYGPTTACFSVLGRAFGVVVTTSFKFLND